MNFCPTFDHSTTKNAHSMFRSSTRHLCFHPKSRPFHPQVTAPSPPSPAVSLPGNCSFISAFFLPLKGSKKAEGRQEGKGRFAARKDPRKEVRKSALCSLHHMNMTTE